MINHSTTSEKNTNPSSNTHKQGIISLFKGSLFYSFSVLIGKGIIFAYSIFLSRMILIDDLGIYYLCQTSVLLLTGFLVMGLDVGVIRFVAISHTHDSNRMSSMLVTVSALFCFLISTLVTGVMLFYIKDISKIFLKVDGFQTIFLYFLISVPFIVLMRIFNSATRGIKIVTYTAYIEQIIIGCLLFTLSAAVLFLSNLGLSGIAIIYLASNVVAFFAAYICMRWHFSITLQGVSWNAFRPILAFSLPLILSQWILYLFTYLNTFMLSYWGVARDVALYNTALRIMVLADIIVTSVVVVFNPTIAELVSHKRYNELHRTYKSASRWVFMACCPFLVLIFCFHNNFLLIFGTKFLGAGTCLMIMSASALIQHSMPMLGALIDMAGYTKISLYNNIASLCVLSGAGYILIPHLGLIGVAITWAISVLLLSTLRAIESKRLFDLNVFQASHVKIIAASILSAGLLKFAYPFFKGLPSFSVLFIILIFGFILFGIMIWLFGLEKDDVFILVEIKKKYKQLYSRKFNFGS